MRNMTICVQVRMNLTGGETRLTSILVAPLARSHPCSRLEETFKIGVGFPAAALCDEPYWNRLVTQQAARHIEPDFLYFTEDGASSRLDDCVV